MRRRHFQLLMLLVLAGIFIYLSAQRKGQAPGVQTSSEHSTSTQSGGKAPAYALEVLQFIDQYDSAPDGYVGGRNFENREKRLPEKNADGGRIRYREWDVHPKQNGQNRGPERLVTGSDKSAWFTPNHYRSFVKIR
jgi:ribonuclease T1